MIILGSKGYYSTFQGLSIAYLSGFEGQSTSVSAESASKKHKSDDDSALVEFAADDVDNLINTCEKRGECVDLLLTNQWPKYVENESKQELVRRFHLNLHTQIHTRRPIHGLLI